jgi:hypothetical protein
MDREQYISQSHAPRNPAELDLKAKIGAVKLERDVARKATLERHCNELDALEAGFNARFDVLYGRTPR